MERSRGITLELKPAFRVSDHSGIPQAVRTPAATPQTTPNHVTFSTKQHL